MSDSRCKHRRNLGITSHTTVSAFSCGVPQLVAKRLGIKAGEMKIDCWCPECGALNIDGEWVARSGGKP